MLEVKNLTVQYGSLTIVDDVSFTVQGGQWLMIVGPNGAGKSTIVNAISQGVPYTGSIMYCGENIAKLKPAQLAKKLGILTQNHHVGYSFTVEEVVRLGRYAYSGGMLSANSSEDEDKIKEALEITGMTAFQGQSVLTLSGGELQRTFLAQVLAQDPQLLLLDEPTNHLDLVYQKQMFELIQKWVERTGRVVVAVVHDLNLAKAYGTNALLLNKGKAVVAGTAADVLSPANINPVYTMDVAKWMHDMYAQWE